MEQDAGLTFTQAITPYLPLVGILAGVIITGLFALWNRKRGAVETRAPDVNELWVQQAEDNKALDLERRLRRYLEDTVYELLVIFKGYVQRVRKGGSPDLNTRETQIYESSYSDLVTPKEK